MSDEQRPPVAMSEVMFVSSAEALFSSPPSWS